MAIVADGETPDTFLVTDGVNKSFMLTSTKVNAVFFAKLSNAVKKVGSTLNTELIELFSTLAKIKV